MSWNHTTAGFEEFDGFIKSLRFQGVKPEVEELEKTVDVGLFQDDRHLRKAVFSYPGRKTKTVVEEFLLVDDHDCDGTSQVAIEVYPAGKRPDLESKTQVVNDD